MRVIVATNLAINVDINVEINITFSVVITVAVDAVDIGVATDDRALPLKPNTIKDFATFVFQFSLLG